MDDDVIDQRKLPGCLISPTSLFKIYWNMLMLVLIIFMAIIIPLRISFEETTPISWVIIDSVFDAIFTVDIVLNFLTAYEDENGMLIIDKKKIAKNYIKAWLLIDLVSSIPISLIIYFTNSGL